MRNLIMIFVAAVSVMLLGMGCLSATQSTITEYDAAGNQTRVTQTSESIVTSLVKSTANKTVVAWESGWAAYLSGSTATTDDPTPHVKLFAGKTDKGMISALPGQKNWGGIAAAISATKYDLQVSSTGISATSSPDDTHNQSK